MKWIVVSVLAAVIISACADVPVHDITSSVRVETSSLAGSRVVKLDFLWVIDNSTSMCQEQQALAQSFDQFASMLKTYLNADIRVAVTNMRDDCDFVNTAASAYPIVCRETVSHACLGSMDCQKEFGPGWDCKCDKCNAADLYNVNGSVTSDCVFHCGDESACCGEFCFQDECAPDESCLKTECSDRAEECLFECRNPQSTQDDNGCVAIPDTAECPSNVPTVLTMNNLDLFKCNASTPLEQDFKAQFEQGLRSGWCALDPEGRNADDVAGFLRPDAYLVLIFVTDEEDCSVDEQFASPNWACETDADCPAYSKCKIDKAFSYLVGQEKRLCHGVIKKDYYGKCTVIGDYKGPTHHALAYDLSKRDCEKDDDCEYGWSCAQGKKCRPEFFNLGTIASYQQPPGLPIFSLAPVSKFYARFKALKSDPSKVLIAAIIGDGMPVASDKESLISEQCLNDQRFLRCQEYAALEPDLKEECVKDPDAEECADFHELKMNCIRECFYVAKGHNSSSTICSSDYGDAELGGRYLELVQMFGPNGIYANICSSAGIGSALDDIAELVIKRVTKICLPRPVKDGRAVRVTKVITLPDGGEEHVTLVEGDSPDGDFKIESPTQACCFPDDVTGECTGTQTAITLNDILEPEASVVVKYESDF